MPTSVSVARQCLTAESAHALDEAVAVARRRGHAQTTSLHAVSALLSFPSSGLRHACARSLAGAGVFYSSQRRLQFKALELCLGVSLDRIQLGQPGSENDLPVSNSLMAAIKRSQAHQRRLPENFRLYHEISQQNQSQTSVSCEKVELRQLIISIIDDPVVSRVLAEAGFRSSEIKLYVRPIPQVFRLEKIFTPKSRYMDAASLFLRLGEAADKSNATNSQCKAYLSAIIVYLYAHDLTQAEKCYNDCTQIDAFLKSDQNRCASKLLTAYNEGDVEEIKRVANSSTISNLDHTIIRLARKLPTGEVTAAERTAFGEELDEDDLT